MRAFISRAAFLVKVMARMFARSFRVSRAHALGKQELDEPERQGVRLPGSGRGLEKDELGEGQARVGREDGRRPRRNGRGPRGTFGTAWPPSLEPVRP